MNSVGSSVDRTHILRIEVLQQRQGFLNNIKELKWYPSKASKERRGHRRTRVPVSLVVYMYLI
jgi:hypothetical protein